MNLHIDVVWKSPIIVVSATAEIHYFREGNETCLLPGVGAEVVLDGNLAVVKDNPFGNTAEILKYLNQRIQKALLILSAVCQSHGSTAVAQSRAEEVDGSFDTAQVDGCLTPVNLQGISCRKDKRDECFLALLAKFFHQSPDGCLAAGEAVFGYQPVIDPFGGVVLLPGSTLVILIQTLSDKGYHILSKYGGLPGVVLP